MQVWDVRRAISALLQRDGWQGTEVGLVGEGDAAVIALHAGTLDPRVIAMRLNDPPAENRDGPDLLNVSRIVELPALVVMNASAEKRIVIVPTEATKKRWQDVAAHYQRLDGAKADSISVR
jgi:hypothetical protein